MKKTLIVLSALAVFACCFTGCASTKSHTKDCCHEKAACCEETEKKDCCEEKKTCCDNKDDCCEDDHKKADNLADCCN